MTLVARGTQRVKITTVYEGFGEKHRDPEEGRLGRNVDRRGSAHCVSKLNCTIESSAKDSEKYLAGAERSGSN